MARSAAGDVRAGVVAAWPTVSAGALKTAVPTASVDAGGLPNGPQPRYVQIVAAPEGEIEYVQPVVSGVSACVAKILLTIKVWVAGGTATEAAGVVSAIAGLILAAFGNESWAIPDSTVLASFAGEPTETEEKEKYNGEPVWRSDVPFHLTLQRTVK